MGGGPSAIPNSRSQRGSLHDFDKVTDEAKGRRACIQAAVGSRSKAMKGLVGGVAHGSPEERARWTESLIPRSEDASLCHPSSEDHALSQTMAWGGGNFQRAKAAMREVGRERTGSASIPYVKLAPLSAPGPMGDRQEHLDAIIDFAGAAHRRKLFCTLDKLTVRWAIGDLPVCCRWLLNTQAIFLKKERETQ